MATRFHVNPETGESNPCTAQVSCRFGLALSDHYSTREEAQSAYENSMQSQTFANTVRTKKPSKLRKLVVVGSLSVSAVTMTACDPGSVTLPEPSDLDSWGTSQAASQEGEAYFQGKPLTPDPSEVQAAKSELAQLAVEEEQYVDYDRELQFDGGFKSGVVANVEHRDAPNVTFKGSTPSSRAHAGDFVDPYTNEIVTIVPGSRSDADVDHIVPLKEVMESGGAKLSEESRVAVANDPANLALVGSSVNRSKSDKDAGDFLPTNESAECVYVIAQVNVKSEYDLSVDSMERDVLSDVLETRC